MITQTKVQEAAECLRSGGVLLYPTATVYGLGGDPTRPQTVERIRTIKGRSDEKPMLILTDRWERILPWIRNVSEQHRRLMAHVPPLEVTILFDAEPDALRAVRAASPRIGVRRTGDLFCREVITQADLPLISTSANLSGRSPPRRFEDVDSGVLGQVDVAVEAGDVLAGQPSTVVAIVDGQLQVLREGAVPETELRRILKQSSTSNQEE